MKHLSTKEISDLVENIGPTLVALGSLCTSRTTPSTWSAGLTSPLPGQMQRLEVMKEVFDTVAEKEDPHTARAWIIGANCVNMTLSPIEAIREGHFTEVRASMQRLLNDDFN